MEYKEDKHMDQYYRGLLRVKRLVLFELMLTMIIVLIAMIVIHIVHM